MSTSYKKVVAINSSSRKRNTYGILNELKNNLAKHDIEVDIINIFDYEIKPCIGCEACIRSSKCIQKDDVDLIMDKLKKYDGIIVSSPVYMGTVTGKMKTFLDRTCKWYHRPELVGKPSLVVSTTAGSDLKSTLNYLEKVAIQWGTMPTGKIGRTVSQLNQSIEYKSYKDFLEHLSKDTSKYRPSLKQLIQFQVQKVLAIKILEIDKEYWKKQGWDKNIFYYDCSIGPVKKSLASSFYKMLYSRIKKVQQ